MAGIKFSPDGLLDVATEPAHLPEGTDGKRITSGAMTRCTNLRLDEAGAAKTRYGSSYASLTAIATVVHRIIEQLGNRYEFASSQIYKNESSIASSLTDAAWSAVKYNPYNVTTQAIYALNGTDRKKIEDTTVLEWGIDPPTAMDADSSSDCDMLCLHDWEEAEAQFTTRTYPAYTDENTWVYLQSWESTHTIETTVWTHHWERDYREDTDDAVDGYCFDWELSESHAATTDLHVTNTSGDYEIFLPFEDSVLDDTSTDETTGDEVKYLASDIQADYSYVWLKTLCMWDFEDALSSNYVRYDIADTTTTSYTNIVNWLDDVLNYECVFEWEKAYLRKEATIPDEGREIKPMFWFESFDDLSNTYSGVDQFAGCQVKFTYARYDGDTLICESNPSDAVKMRPLHAPIIVWAASSDSQVTHVRAYRTLDNDGYFYYDSTHEVGNLRAQLNNADSALGSLVEDDHDRPPLGTVVVGPSFDGVCFIIKDNLLYNCKPKQPEYWPADYYVELDVPQHPGKAACFFNGLLYAATQFEIYLIQGTGVTTFVPLPMNASTGALNEDCFVPVQGRGIYHLGHDGLYLFSGAIDVRVSDERFRPVFEGDTAGSIPGLNLTYISRCWIKQYRNKLFFAYPGGTSAYPDNFLVSDLMTSRTVHYHFSAQFVTAVWDRTNDELLAADTDGYIWHLEDEATTEDNLVAISWELRSKEFNYLRQFFPRFARWDVDPATGASVSGKVYLDGTSVQSHSVTTRKFSKRLVKTSTGQRLAVGLSGSGNVTIYQAEVE